MQIMLNPEVTAIVSEAAKFVISENESVKSHGNAMYNCLKLGTLDSNHVVVTAANGHAFYTARATAIVPETGEFVMPASTLRGALERFSSGSLEVSGNVVHVKEGRGKLNFTADISGTFPSIPQFESDSGKFTMKTETFLRGLDMVFYASMKDDSRPILESVRISIQDDKIRFDAVNGYVAARFMATVNQDIFVESFSEAVIPAWVVKQLLGDRQVKASEKITLVKSKKAVVTKCGEIIILSNELNGEFMDMENFFKLADLTLICDMASVTEIMKKVELVSSSAGYEKTSAPLVLDYDPDDGRLNFRISSSTSVLEDSIECEANGELKTVHMGFNPSFLKQAIWQVDTDKIGFNFGSNLSPLVILPQYEKEDFSAVHIVVPVRIKQAEESEKNA
jgi:DNA polymerase-3 subunit beta